MQIIFRSDIIIATSNSICMPSRNRVFSLIIVLAVISCNTKKKDTSPTASMVNCPGINFTNFEVNSPARETFKYSEQYVQSVTQHFKAGSINPTNLKAKNGLRIRVNPTMLEKEDGSAVDGVINVDLVELKNSEELFKAGVPTESEGRLLASGGSYFIGMACNGRKLRIKKDCSLIVNFPILTPGKMELFYSDLPGDNKPSGKILKAEFQPLNDSGLANPDTINPATTGDIKNSSSCKMVLYDSLKSLVFFGKKPITIRDFVDTLQYRGIDISIDSLMVDNLNNKGSLSKGRYSKRYRILTGKERQVEEKNELAKKENQLKDKTIAQSAMPIKKFTKYYNGTAITSLGWINCATLFETKQVTDVTFQIPANLAKCSFQYYISFKSFNGFVSGKAVPDDHNICILKGLPAGQPITLVTFVESEGRLLEAGQEYIIKKAQPLVLDFKAISSREMKRMFTNSLGI